jgi:hypothetical protein
MGLAANPCEMTYIAKFTPDSGTVSPMCDYIPPSALYRKRRCTINRTVLCTLRLHYMYRRIEQRPAASRLRPYRAPSHTYLTLLPYLEHLQQKRLPVPLTSPAPIHIVYKPYPRNRGDVLRQLIRKVCST